MSYKFLLSALCFLVFQLPLHAALTYTVTPGQGDPANRIYDTIQEALTAATSGSVVDPNFVEIEGGHYDLHQSIPGDFKESSNLQLNNKSNIVIRPKDGHHVTIDGNNLVTTNASIWHGLRILSSTDNITVQNIRFIKCMWGGIEIKTSDNLRGGHVIDNCRFHANLGHGIVVQRSKNVVITGCEFRYTKDQENPNSPGVLRGIGCWTSAAVNLKIENCLSRNNDDDGFLVEASH